MLDFFSDPSRSRYLYLSSLVIDKCQKAIKTFILDPDTDSYTTHRHGLVHLLLYADVDTFQ